MEGNEPFRKNPRHYLGRGRNPLPSVGLLLAEVV